MSWKAWSEEGFGYEIDCGNAEKIRDFILKHEDVVRLSEKEKKELKESESWDDLCFIMDRPSDVVSEIINKLEGYTVFQGFNADEADHGESFGVGKWFPWQVKGNNARVTLDEVKLILKKYGEELGVDKDPDYFEMEYCG